MEEILIIDDNKTTLDILRTILKAEGYAVTCCPDSLAALDMAREKVFNIFLIDYRMPYMNGVEATAILRKLRPDELIIGFSIENKESAFLDAGADVFVRKDDLHRWLAKDLRGLSRNRSLTSMSISAHETPGKDDYRETSL
jgi:CheY-like chemotaxis protein